MHHHIIHDAVRCLDDFPVKLHFPPDIAATPARFEGLDVHRSRFNADKLGVAQHLIMKTQQADTSETDGDSNVLAELLAISEACFAYSAPYSTRTIVTKASLFS